MKRLILIFLIFLMLPLVSAQIESLGTFKTESCVNLKQTCTNCTFINLSVTSPPNQNEIVTNQTMNRSTSNLWVYTFCNTSVNGDYIYDTFGDLDGKIEQSSISFIVNPIGKVLTNAQAILYFLALVVALLFFILFVFFGTSISSDNKRDEMTGYILATSNLKYLKMFIISLAYLTLMVVLYFVYIISYGYLDMDFLGNLFYFGFIFMVVLILPLFIVGVFIIGANIVKDSKISDTLSRGVRIR